ncbi:hypothetical protein E3N88_08812 [Mikania micrantha]|uniref:Uncharacterized protein n=1 Tax=Mikania micrantha TaxID=192012 RepID=A0A5N6PJK6_9ASTR|nr:hypothetical protein E3N88_08812 [Mikania micrantha]
MCDVQSGSKVGHPSTVTQPQSVGDGGSGTTNDWRATIGRRRRIRDKQQSVRDGIRTISDDRRPEEPQSLLSRAQQKSVPGKGVHINFNSN